MTRRIALGFLISLASFSSLAAQGEPSTLAALHITEPISLNGSLDEPAWRRAPHVTAFTQRDPEFGQPASERTEVAVLFDADAIYVGFWGYDSDPEGIRAKEMARDFRYDAEDDFEIVIDPFDDDRNGYRFVTNANGASNDALIAGGDQNQDWNGVWDVRSRRTSEGWFSEVRIPFSTLRFPTGGARPWGINFQRDIRRKHEQVLWQGWSRNYRLENLSHAGGLAGIQDVAGTRLAEARPYVLGGLEWQDARGRSSVHGIGGELSYLPLPSLKINLTARPDFAQVESDRQQVNLSRFSLFFPEKRTFFLEGSEFFAFNLGGDVQPFYSRRIGLAADRTVVPILGGARVLGKSGGTTLGAMALRTEAEGVEPAAAYGVVRWKRDVAGQSSVGLIAVGRTQPGWSAATYGLDLRYATSSLFGDREFQAGLAVAQSFVSNAADRFGLSHQLYLNYPNDLVNFQLSWARTDSSFDPRVGFVQRSNFQKISSQLTINPRPRFLKSVRQLEIKPFGMNYYRDARTGALQSFQTELVPLAIRFQSGDNFEFNVQRRADHPDKPFEPIPGVTVPVGTYWSGRWEVQLRTDQARRLSASFETNEGGFYEGRRRETTLSTAWKQGRHLSVSGQVVNNRLTFDARVHTVNEVTGRFDFAVSPNLFGAVSGQWNSQDDAPIVNFRLNWIPSPGSDLFLVINQQADSRATFWSPTHTTAVSKLVWRIAL